MVQAVNPIRKLTDEEQKLFSAAAVYAIVFIPSFRDAVALLRPFYDASAKTAYTDKFARVGLSPWFFEELDTYQQASVLLHETMHVLNNHFVREEALNIHPKIGNIAGDFEINCGLSRLPTVDLSYGIFPDKMPFNYERDLSLEQYAHLLKEDVNDGKFGDATDPDCPQHGDKNEASSSTPNSSNDKTEKSDEESKGADPSDTPSPGNSGEGADQNEASSSGSPSNSTGAEAAGNSSEGTDSSGSKGDCTCPTDGIPMDQSGKGSGCDEASDERSSAADEAGISRASDSEQTIAKKNTTARVVEELKKGRQAGHGSMHDFLMLSQRMMAPPKVKWQSIFRRVLSKANDSVVRGRADYSYQRVNRRTHNSEFIFPGMVQYTPKAMMAIDSSGSMDNSDFNKALNEAEGIIRTVGKGKDFLRVFFIDTKVGNIKPVSSVSKLKITGGGGTDMSVGVRYVNELSAKEKPDIFVLITDGYTNWVSYEREVKRANRRYNHILLITQKGGYDSVPSSLKKLITVIDISGAR